MAMKALTLKLAEIARVLVRLNHVARFIELLRGSARRKI
jgi:hypothetical protein